MAKTKAKTKSKPDSTTPDPKGPKDGSGADNPPPPPKTDRPAAKWGMIALILLPALGIIVCSQYYDWWTMQARLKLSAGLVLSLFLPLLAYSYYFFRRARREAEVIRIMTKLHFPEDSTYADMFKSIRSGPHFIIAAGIAWVISCAGMTVLFLGDELKLGTMTFSSDGNLNFPKTGSRLIFSMAFLGAYFWGLQYTFRRYVLNDLIPGVFYSLSMRMLVAATLALLIFNAFESLMGTGAETSDKQTIDAVAWPAFAFLLGAFPQRGLQWLMARVPFLSGQPDPSVRALPLEMIEGVQTYDRMRLEELGIDSCHDLATYDFIPLVLKTSYGAREITDWILQAKLCVCCGEAVKDLRQHGIRGLLDVADLNDQEIAALAKETSVTESSLRRAKSQVENDPELGRLREVAARLSEYTHTV